ncbi:MAG: PIN domain-containing protein [Verrucomicrobia bacterium]|nr:PIN domain-containing protein [Verrucomicrobiota bacterium]
MPEILAFVDTNVLLYAASTDPTEAGKRTEARRVLSDEAFAFSVQVAQEFFVNATRKLTPALSSADALAFLKGINPATVVAIDYKLFEEATKIQQRFQISYWDAAIVAAAKRVNCGTLYSEDLSEGQSYGGVRVVNPFRSIAKT